MSGMEYVQTLADPADQLALIEDLWMHEAQLYIDAANHSGHRAQALEHCDALLDAALQIKSLGKLACG